MDKVKLSAENEEKAKEKAEKFVKLYVDTIESLEKIKSDLQNEVDNAKKVTKALDEKCPDKI